VGALRLVRSFLLLEDDCSDWEAGQDEHPHRRAAKLPRRDRRPGAIEAREQVCSVAMGGQRSDRPPRTTTDIDACQPTQDA
jgi:hypothetical protein